MQFGLLPEFPKPLNPFTPVSPPDKSSWYDEPDDGDEDDD